ncbi:MAG: DUF5723 family protein [Candidatus Krumholzibacteriia bacterium]
MTRHDRPTGRARSATAPVLLALIGLAAAPGAPALAQGSARAWGMGGAATATARGLDAVDWNPANLALARPGFSLGLASLAADLHNNAFTLSRYNELSGATLSTADKARILADIPAGGFAVQADVRAAAGGLGLGNAALTLSVLGGGTGRVAKDFFDLVLMGNPIDRAFTFDGTGGEGYAVGAATLSAGVPLVTGYRTRLCAGANLRYLRGLYELHFEEATGGLVTTMDGVAGDARASYVTASGGVGWAVDLGLTLQAPRGWTLGLACDNVASAMDWDGDPERRTWTASADSLNATQEDFDALVADSDTTCAVAPYRTTLPRRLRLGASNTVGPLLVALDVAQGLADRAGTTTRTEFRTGVEWRPCGWLLPRAGAAVGGEAGRAASAGLGLRVGPWRLDLAAVNRGGFRPRDTKGLGIAAQTRLEF